MEWNMVNLKDYCEVLFWGGNVVIYIVGYYDGKIGGICFECGNYVGLFDGEYSDFDSFECGNYVGLFVGEYIE